MLSGMLAAEASFRALTGDGIERDYAFHQLDADQQANIIAEEERKRVGEI